MVVPICLQDWMSCTGCFLGTTALEADVNAAPKNTLNNEEVRGQSWKEMEGGGNDMLSALF